MLLRLPTVTCTIMPISDKSDLHVHTYDPHVLWHVAFLWHLPVNASHLLVSVVKLERNRGKNSWIKYQLKTKAFWFLSKSHRNSAIRKNLNFFEGFLLLVFSGGNFQLSYYFWALLAVTILSIWHTYELLLFCHRKASNIQGK